LKDYCGARAAKHIGKSFEGVIFLALSLSGNASSCAQRTLLIEL
jgi:hypothetical protein